MISTIAAIVFLWTNPSLNVDGTQCYDLASVTIHAQREVDSYELNQVRPMCNIDETGTTRCLSGPGLPDSLQMLLPQRQGIDYWKFYITATDSTGNESDSSNVVRLDIGNHEPITGIGDLPDNLREISQWFDVRGRKINEPKASGVYFRRINGIVRKVIIIK